MKFKSNQPPYKEPKNPICEDCKHPFIRTRGQGQIKCLLCINGYERIKK